jgi:hypothetical protein
MTSRLPSVSPALCVCALFHISCGPGRVAPQDVTALRVEAQVGTLDAPAFADQSGGGLFVDGQSGALRLRMDGSKGPLESHPGNAAAPGVLTAVHPLGAHSALAVAQNGLYVAQAGWLIAPPWRSHVSPEGVLGTAATADGAVWIAHQSGLYRLREGLLSELKISGEAVEGLTALVGGPTSDGRAGLWLAQPGKLSVVELGATLTVQPAALPASELSQVRALAVADGSSVGAQELWVLTELRLWRLSGSTVEVVELDGLPEQLCGAGSVLWARLPDALLAYQSASRRWRRVENVEAAQLTLLGCDASGSVWVREGERTLSLNLGPVPRLSGLDHGMRVFSGEVTVQARPAPGAVPAEVAFQLDEGDEVLAVAPHFSWGGVGLDGAVKASSLHTLTPGWHRLRVQARYADGSQVDREVPFEFEPIGLTLVGWEKEIKPLFDARCAACHAYGPAFDLSSHALWQANKDAILSAVRDRRMPADGPLASEQIKLIENWVTAGGLP